MIYVIRAVESRRKYVEEMQKTLPQAVVYYDEFHDAMKSFLYVCKNIIGDQECVLMQDDIIFCNDFQNKIESVISEHPDTLINFFSLSKKYLKPHFKCGREFCMAQCVYFPKGFANKIIEKYDEWVKYDNGKNPTADDFLIGYAWGLSNKYFIWQPSLVQHIECKSVIDQKRSTKRQSITFVK